MEPVHSPAIRPLAVCDDAHLPEIVQGDTNALDRRITTGGLNDMRLLHRELPSSSFSESNYILRSSAGRASVG